MTNDGTGDDGVDLAQQVTGQASGRLAPRPWAPRTDVRASLADGAELADYQALASSDEAILAADAASIIVAVTPPVLRFLGYEHEDQLVGRRLIVIVPERFHQAHIAGTTLHVTNGRDPLLGIDLTVPVVRADGTERSVSLNVSPTPAGQGRIAFVARFHLPEP